jgi:hypothetical protein
MITSMARGNCTFRKRDLEMAVKAVIAGGCQVARVEIDRTGKMVIVMGSAATEATASIVNEWDRP